MNYDLVEHLKISTQDICMPTLFWERFDANKFGIIKDISLWKDFKYINDDDSLNENINMIDNTKGGIYVFYINPDIVPNVHRYLMYIGKAEITDRQNIRKRLKDYFDYVTNPDKDERPRVRTLFHYWKKYIHVKFILLENNQFIRELESALIDAIQPPINVQIPNQEIRVAKAAFGG